MKRILFVSSQVASNGLPESFVILGLPYVGKSSVAEALSDRIEGSFVANLQKVAENMSENLDAGERTRNEYQLTW